MKKGARRGRLRARGAELGYRYFGLRVAFLDVRQSLVGRYDCALPIGRCGDSCKGRHQVREGIPTHRKLGRIRRVCPDLSAWLTANGPVDTDAGECSSNVGRPL
jgi:hypothetical protein